MELPGATSNIDPAPGPLNLGPPALPKASKMLRTEGTEDGGRSAQGLTRRRVGKDLVEKTWEKPEYRIQHTSCIFFIFIYHDKRRVQYQNDSSRSRQILTPLSSGSGGMCLRTMLRYCIRA